MKIGIYDPYLDTLGGGEKYMMTLAECLSSDHEVSVFWDTEDDLNKAAKRFAISTKLISLHRNIFTRKYSFRERMKESKKFDAIFYLSDGSIPIISCPLFVHFQFPIEWVNPGIITKLKFKRVKEVFCNSQFTKKYIDAKLGIRSTVVYPPVDMHPLTDIKKENIILHVGRFMGNTVEGDDYKKQQFMASTFIEMVDSGLKGWKFVIASSVREDQETVFSEFKNNVKGYPVEFVVNCNNKDLWDYYQKAKIYWHASGYGENLKKHPERAEHFGISTVEAMHAGAVPVVIEAGGQPEIVEHGINGLLWKTSEELKNYTHRLIRESLERTQLSENAQRSAQQFSKQAFNRHIHRLLS